MDTYVILTLSTLILLSYVFEITSKKTKIPTVLLLIFLGFGIKKLVKFININIPAIENLLPTIGTIGLILIVFEATVDLKLSREKIPIFFKSILFSLLSIIFFSSLFSIVLVYFYKTTFYQAILNSIPLSVISSAIAIPSISNYKHLKEFVVYDSSFSDIFGILFFNLFLLFDQGNIFSNTVFYFLEIVFLVVFSIIAIIVLTIFIRKINHHVKFIPIIIFIILLYQIMKIYHLPGLIFVLIFGLSVANFDLILQINEKYFFKYHLILEEILYFKSIISEITFLIRSVFFLLLGYSLTFEIDNFSSLFIILIILFLIFLIRFGLLKLMKLPAEYYVWIAPRGLITVVLFFSIPYHLRINLLNDTIIVLTILSTTIIMSLSLFTTKISNNKI